LVYIMDGTPDGMVKIAFFGGGTMFTRMLSTDAIRASPKSLAALGVSLVFASAALPALAQQQGQTAPNVPVAPYGYGHMIWGAPGWGIPSR
jgi:hypothetical protein